MSNFNPSNYFHFIELMEYGFVTAYAEHPVMEPQEFANWIINNIHPNSAIIEFCDELERKIIKVGGINRQYEIYLLSAVRQLLNEPLREENIIEKTPIYV